MFVYSDYFGYYVLIGDYFCEKLPNIIDLDHEIYLQAISTQRFCSTFIIFEFKKIISAKQLADHLLISDWFKKPLKLLESSKVLA